LRRGSPSCGEPTVSEGEIAQDLRQHYQTTQSRDLKEAEYRLKHLESFFAGKRIAALDPAEITAYVKKRQAEGMSFPTPFRIPGVGTEVNARKISGEPGIPRV
jgi:hypothetical protein